MDLRDGNITCEPTKLRCNGNLTTGKAAFEQLNLRSTQEIPRNYRSIFGNIPYFNVVQSTVLDDVLYSDKSIVVCAPTGSGKTMIFEIAIVRMLMKCDEYSLAHSEQKIVYMAPIKALCTQRHQEWLAKFGPIGLRCTQLTGDSNNDDIVDLQRANIIFTTPEKWDSTTRRWQRNIALISQVRLFLIDEVHLLNDEDRGATMEAVVSRMKTKHAYLSIKSGSGSSFNQTLRFVAVSATIPNVDDIAHWLSSSDSSAVPFSFSEELRPVKLNIVVIGYPCYSGSEFKFDFSLNYKLQAVIDSYSSGKPTLVFCATRKSVEQAAGRLAGGSRYVQNDMHQRYLNQIARMIKCHKLRDCIMCGIAFHHAGLDLQDRQLVEKGFVAGHIPVLFSTTTLAMGVNLPAHLVIVKSTSHYVKGVCEEYSQSEIMQMVGRAGRPQFDTDATAVIMTRQKNRERYQNLVSGTKHIESSLHKHLIEHLNAEIALGTIPNMNFMLEWIRSTFLYIRALKNPTHYGYQADLRTHDIEQHLYDLCSSNLHSLTCEGLAAIKESSQANGLQTTATGRLMAQYCIAFATMKDFMHLPDTPSLQEMIFLVANCREFNDIMLRVSEKSVLNQLNKGKSSATVRYPMDGRIKSPQMKVNCLLQAVLGNLPVQDFSLQQDVTKIFRTANRISKCYKEFQFQNGNFRSLHNALKFAQCIKARMWENSPFVCRQLPGIGPVLATALANAGVRTFSDLTKKNPRDIELILNRHPPFGNRILEAVRYLPKYDVKLKRTGKRYSTINLCVNVSLQNVADLRQKQTIFGKHCCILLIGDSSKNILLKQKISDEDLLRSQWSSNFVFKDATIDAELEIAFCSQDWVGLDVEFSWSPFLNAISNSDHSIAGELMPPAASTSTSQSKYFSPYERHPKYSTSKDDVAKTEISLRHPKNSSLKISKKRLPIFSEPKSSTSLDFSSQNVSNWMSQFVYQKKDHVSKSSQQSQRIHLQSSSMPHYLCNDDHITSSTGQCFETKTFNEDEETEADSAISMYVNSIKNTGSEDEEMGDGIGDSRAGKRKWNSTAPSNPARNRLTFQECSSNFNRCFHEPNTDDILPNFDLQWDSWDDDDSSPKSGHPKPLQHSKENNGFIVIDDEDDGQVQPGTHGHWGGNSNIFAGKQQLLLKQTPDDTPVSYKKLTPIQSSLQHWLLPQRSEKSLQKIKPKKAMVCGSSICEQRAWNRQSIDRESTSFKPSFQKYEEMQPTYSPVVLPSFNQRFKTSSKHTSSGIVQDRVSRFNENRAHCPDLKPVSRRPLLWQQPVLDSSASCSHELEKEKSGIHELKSRDIMVENWVNHSPRFNSPNSDSHKFLTGGTSQSRSPLSLDMSCENPPTTTTKVADKEKLANAQKILSEILDYFDL